MVGTQVASLYAAVGADISGFKSGLGQVDNILHSTGGKLNGFTSMLGTGLVAATGAAVAGLGTLIGVTAKATNQAANMQQAVADIAASMNLTADETAKVDKLITDLGIDPKLKVSATEAAAAIEMLGRNGLDLDGILGGAARSTVLLANSTKADFGTAANIATDVMAQFKISAKDMATAVNGITGVTIASKFGINDYQLALSQAGGVASSVGVSFEDFNASISAISPLFASGSDAGTSFKTFLQRLVPQSNEAADAMRKIGLFSGLSGSEFEDVQKKIEKVRESIAKLDPTNKNYRERSAELNKELTKLRSQLVAGGSAFFDANGKMKGMAEIADALKKSFGGLSEAQRIEYATTIFGSDAMRAMFALADGGADAINKLKEEIGNTDAEASAAKRMDTLKGDYEIFSGIIETLSIKIGNKFIPQVREMVQWLTKLAIDNSDQIIDFFSGIASYGADVSRKARDIFQSFTSPGVVKTITILKGALVGLGKALSVLVRPFKDALGGLFQELSLVRSTGFTDIFGVIINQVVKALADFVATIGSKVIPTVLKKLGEMWTAITTWVKEATLTGKFTQWINAFTTWAGEMWAIISPYLSEFWGWLIGWVIDPQKRQQLWDGITTVVSTLWDWAKDVWSNVSPYLSSFWGWITSWVTDSQKRQQLWNGITNIVSTLWDWAKSVWTNVSPYLSGFWKWLTSWITDPQKRQQLWNGITSTWTAFTEWASAIWGWIKPNLISMYNSIIKWIDEQKPGLGTSLDGWLQSFVNFITAVKKAWQENFPEISRITSDNGKKIANDIGNMIYALKQLFGFMDTDAVSSVSDYAKIFTAIYDITARVAAGVVKTVSSMVQALSLLKQAISAMGSGDLGQLNNIAGQLNNIMSGMQGTIIEDLAKYIDPLYWLGLRPEGRSGGAGGTTMPDANIVDAATVSARSLIDTYGPDINNVNATMQNNPNTDLNTPVSTGVNQGRIDIYVHGESDLPADRNKIREIARALQREMQLSGGRVSY